MGMDFNVGDSNCRRNDFDVYESTKVVSAIRPRCMRIDLYANRPTSLYSYSFILRPLCSKDSGFFLKSEQMYAFFDDGGYPASVVQAGHHRAQLIDRPSALHRRKKVT